MRGEKHAEGLMECQIRIRCYYFTDGDCLRPPLENDIWSETIESEGRTHRGIRATYKSGREKWKELDIF